MRAAHRTSRPGLPGIVRCAIGLLAIAGVATPSAALAQVFIASRPHPPFSIAPLFVSATVRNEDIARPHGALPVTVSWSVALPADRTAADIAQDLYLLWPGEITGTAGPDGADAGLARQVESLGFRIKEHGRLRLAARSRATIGTGAGVRDLGHAPFVTFVRPEGPAREARGASLVHIPWIPELASIDWLARLEVPVKDAISPRRVSWLEDTFWGRRHIIALSFGDVGYVTLYPLYFGARNRVIPLAPDFSQLLINFTDAGHLKIDELAPSSARRRPSETRENTEAFSLPLLASDGLTPQVLRVQFTYFRGRVPWRPILFSALFLGLGNLTGPLVAALIRRLAAILRAHVHVGRGGVAGRESGAVPSRETLERLRPGETTYDDVVRLCGGDPDEEQRLPSGEICSVVYRGRRIMPRRQRSFGWFATVSQWDVEQHEVQIDFERQRVRDIQARVRRSRLAQPAGV
jgi:hypothetical protein